MTHVGIYPSVSLRSSSAITCRCLTCLASPPPPLSPGYPPAVATDIAVGKTSFEDCDMLTWSLGCTGSLEPTTPPSISIARFDITSLYRWRPPTCVRSMLDCYDSWQACRMVAQPSKT
jgi:hypothetical protein